MIDTPRPHLGDLLSGLLDDELAPQEHAVALEHLATCRQCSIELSQVSAARAWVRALPPVEPPLGFIDRLIREQQDSAVPVPWLRRGRAGVAALALSAAAGIGLLGLASPRDPPVSPQVGQLVETHAASASLAGDPLSEFAPVAVRVNLRR